MLWTVLLLAPLIRAYTPPEQLLIVGPITRLIKRYLGFYVLDFLVLLLSIWLSFVLLRDISPLSIHWPALLQTSVAYLMIYAIVAVKTGVNLTRWEKATPPYVVRLSMAWLIATAVALGFYFTSGPASDPKQMLILTSPVFFLMGILLVRYRSRVLSGPLKRIMIRRANSKVAAERVLIVGSGRTAEHILWLLDHPTYSGKYQVVGIIDDDLFSQGMNVYGVKVLGETKDMARVIVERDVGLLILADHRLAASNYRIVHEAALSSLARVVVAPDIFGSMESPFKFALGDMVVDELDNFQCRHCLARRSFRVEMQVDETKIHSGAGTCFESARRKI